MFCTKCGAKLPESARFCPHCGAAVRPAGDRAQGSGGVGEEPRPLYTLSPEPANKARKRGWTHWGMGISALAAFILLFAGWLVVRAPIDGIFTQGPLRLSVFRLGALTRTLGQMSPAFQYGVPAFWVFLIAGLLLGALLCLAAWIISRTGRTAAAGLSVSGAALGILTSLGLLLYIHGTAAQLGGVLPRAGAAYLAPTAVPWISALAFGLNLLFTALWIRKERPKGWLAAALLSGAVALGIMAAAGMITLLLRLVAPPAGSTPNRLPFDDDFLWDDLF